MAILFIVAAALGLYLGGFLSVLLPLGVATAYVLAMGPGAFSAGRELSEEKLEAGLSAKWLRADEIAKYIVSNWASIKYIRSAASRGGNASFMSLGCFLLAAWYFYSDMGNAALAWSGLCAVSLWLIGNKVNKALFIITKARSHPHWELNCINLLAASEIFGEPVYRRVVEESTDINTLAEVLSRNLRS